jgi:hypothetical protein
MGVACRDRVHCDEQWFQDCSGIYVKLSSYETQTDGIVRTRSVEVYGRVEVDIERYRCLLCCEKQRLRIMRGNLSSTVLEQFTNSM